MAWCWFCRKYEPTSGITGICKACADAWRPKVPR